MTSLKAAYAEDKGLNIWFLLNDLFLSTKKTSQTAQQLAVVQADSKQKMLDEEEEAYAKQSDAASGAITTENGQFSGITKTTGINIGIIAGVALLTAIFGGLLLAVVAVLACAAIIMLGQMINSGKKNPFSKDFWAGKTDSKGNTDGGGDFITTGSKESIDQGKLTQANSAMQQIMNLIKELQNQQQRIMSTDYENSAQQENTVVQQVMSNLSSFTNVIRGN